MYNKGVCKKCGEEKVIVNKHFYLCQQCNQTRLNAGKETKLKGIKYKHKKTGEKELFLEIWEEREHVCVKCSINLGEEPKAYMFSHIKPKSTHPELRLNKNNIELTCFDCHFEHEFGVKKGI